MRRRLWLTLALVAALVPAGAARAAGCAPDGHRGGDWPMFGHDLANTRHQPSSNIDPLGAWTMIASAWTFTAPSGGGDFSGTPVVADACVFVGSNTGWVFALDADTGEQVWSAQVDGPVKSSGAVQDGRAFFTVSRAGSPYAVAFDAGTGALLWESAPLSDEPGSETYGSPIVYDGMVYAGVSGVSPESDDADPTGNHRGSFSLLDVATGAEIVKTYTIPDEDFANGYGGGGLWPTPAVDVASGYAYAATGNPYRDDLEHANVNAIVKIDLDRDRATFGQIVASFKPVEQEAIPGTSHLPPCEGTDRLPLAGPAGDSLVPHLDFGASPNLFTDASGRLLVGDGQKSGVYHTLDADTFEPVWQTLAGPYGPFGGIVSSAAFDGERLYGGVTPGGYLFALDRTSGDCAWVSPVADGVHYGHPVASSGGVIWTADAKGFLHAYGAGNGAPLMPKPLWFWTQGRPASTFGGVSIARDTVYVAVGLQVAEGNVGSVVAYRSGF